MVIIEFKDPDTGHFVERNVSELPPNRDGHWGIKTRVTVSEVTGLLIRTGVTKFRIDVFTRIDPTTSQRTSKVSINGDSAIVPERSTLLVRDIVLGLAERNKAIHGVLMRSWPVPLIRKNKATNDPVEKARQRYRNTFIYAAIANGQKAEYVLVPDVGPVAVTHDGSPDYTSHNQSPVTDGEQVGKTIELGECSDIEVGVAPESHVERVRGEYSDEEKQQMVEHWQDVARLAEAQYDNTQPDQPPLPVKLMVVTQKKEQKQRTYLYAGSATAFGAVEYVHEMQKYLMMHFETGSLQYSSSEKHSEAMHELCTHHMANLGMVPDNG